MSDTLIKVENIRKKFCRNLKRSLWYGVKDLGSELIGCNNSHKSLRKEEFWTLQDISFELKRGDTLGLIGRNGAGKTTLLRMLNGLIKPDGGCIEVKGRMQALIALGAGFNPILTGRENIYVNASVLGIPKAEIDRQFDEIVAFSGIEEFIDTPVQSYSSGMAVRLGFAVAAHMEPDILLVDEVLAVGDIGFQSKCLNKIGELKERGVGIILVSHNMHTISTFANEVILLNGGEYQLFTNVAEGIREYRKIFADKNNMAIEKVCNGNDHIKIINVDINKRELNPTDSFCIKLHYESSIKYNNIEIGIGVYSSNEPNLHFQATNKTYEKKLNLLRGQHCLNIVLHNMMINGASATITLTIWSENRTEQIFWWRIPVRFHSIPFSTGNNFMKASFLPED